MEYTEFKANVLVNILFTHLLILLWFLSSTKGFILRPFTHNVVFIPFCITSSFSVKISGDCQFLNHLTSPSRVNIYSTVKVEEITFSPFWCLMILLTEALDLYWYEHEIYCMDVQGFNVFLIKWTGNGNYTVTNDNWQLCL